jgi:hypothetical protein
MSPCDNNWTLDVSSIYHAEKNNIGPENRVIFFCENCEESVQYIWCSDSSYRKKFFEANNIAVFKMDFLH